ncbi:MAG: hypothetical protein KAS32_16605, partial [Candidatus Peribacteraceae bacterium]|nr:hypothetical protein [Candidatus Peribacteraceae bacterium]
MSGEISPREHIIDILKQHPEGLTITAISDLTKLHRHTVTKYMYELRGADIIYERSIGPARLCYLKDGFTKKKERETMKRLNGNNMKSSLGQIQILAVVLFLALAPAVVITAHNFTNMTNGSQISLEGFIVAGNEGATSNLSGDYMEEIFSSLNVTNETNGTDNLQELIDIVIGNSTNGTNITIPEIEIPVTNITNETDDNSTETNMTLIEIPNSTVNETGPENGTIIELPNETVNETVNETNIIATQPEIKILSFKVPETINMTEEFMVSAEIVSLYNISTSVSVELVLPDNFEGNNLVQNIPFLEKDVTAILAWKVTANECGNYILKINAENKISSDSESFEIFVECNLKSLIIESETIQGDAEVGKPVKWRKIVRVENSNPVGMNNIEIGVDLPIESSNIKLKKVKELFNNFESNIPDDDMGRKISILESLEEKMSKWFEDEIKPETSITYEIEYETPAPQVVEEKINDYSKRVMVLSDTHYENIVTHTRVREITSDVKTYSVYRTTDGTREPVDDLIYLDADNDNLIDGLQWITPQLSNQTYEIEITILNIQSYPVVGGTWEVRFKTVGKANLTIKPINGTTWNNIDENRDLKFLELLCGNLNVDYEWVNNSVFVEDYYCNETGYEISKVLTEGKHHLEFTFGELSAYADNYASTTLIINASNSPYQLCGVVDQYTKIVVQSDGTLSICSHEEGGTTTGLADIDLDVNGNFTVYSGGIIDGEGSGGGGGDGCANIACVAYQGTDGLYGNPGGQDTEANDGGGGGGQRNNGGTSAGGGGGSFGGAGGTGGNHATNSQGGSPGDTYSSSDGTTLYTGSGGGGGAHDVPGVTAGGMGGGGLKVNAGSGVIEIHGTVNLNGIDGEGHNAGDSGTGAGGSGGHLILIAGNIDINSSTLDVSAGDGGDTGTLGDDCSGAGGGGGRIAIFYGISFSNTSTIDSEAGGSAGTQGCDVDATGGSAGTIYYEYDQSLVPSLLIYNIRTANNGTYYEQTKSGYPLTMNVSIENKNGTTMSGNLTFVLKNTTSDIVYSNTVYDISWSIGEDKDINFSSIDTTGWEDGYYWGNVTVYWDGGNNSRIETMAFQVLVSPVTIIPDYPIGQCLGINYTMIVNITNDWNSSVTINVTPHGMGTDFEFDPVYSIVVVPPNSHNTTYFNITLPSTLGYYNMTVNGTYTDPVDLPKNSSDNTSFNIPGPSITVTREAPMVFANLTTIYPRIVIHNDGCSLAENIQVNETIPSAFNVDTDWAKSNGATDAYDVSEGTRIIWDIDRLAINEFQIFYYKMRSPTSSTNTQYGPWTTSYYDIKVDSYYDSESPQQTLRTETTNYSHMNFSIEMNSTFERIAFPGEHVFYNLTMTNIGLANATENEINITVYIDTTCNVVDTGGGTWNSTSREILWTLDDNMTINDEKTYNFTLNCTEDKTEMNILPTFYSSQTIYYSVCDPNIDEVEIGQGNDFNYTLTKENANSQLVGIDVWAGAGDYCPSSISDNGWDDWDGGECGYIYLYNTTMDGSVTAWEWCNVLAGDDLGVYRDQGAATGMAPHWINITSPDNFTDAAYVTNDEELIFSMSDVPGTGRGTGERLCFEEICYMYKWTGIAEEPHNIFVKVRDDVVPDIINETVLNVTENITQGWAMPWNFSATVRDTTGDDVNLTLWLDFGSGWVFYDNWTCTSCSSWTTHTFDVNFTCSDIDDQIYYKFIAQDVAYFQNITNQRNFSVRQEDMAFEIISGHGANAIANRTSTMTNLTLKVRVIDENGTYLPNLNTTLYISQLGTIGGSMLWDTGTVIETDSGGNITLNFTAGDHCDNESTPYDEEEYEVGPHWWYIKINPDETCYKQTNSTAEGNLYDYYNFTTVGELVNTIVGPTGNSIIQQGRSNVSITTYIYNYCQEAMKINTNQVTFNLSTFGADYLCSGVIRVGENVYTCEWDTLNRTDGVYNFTMSSSEDNYYNDTELEEDAFTLRTVPMLKDANV